LQASLWLPGYSYLVTLRARGQLEADAPVIILLRRRLQVKLGQRDFAIVARREVIERLAHYRVILNLRLMTILENQHGLRLVGWRFDWFRCRRGLAALGNSGLMQQSGVVKN